MFGKINPVRLSALAAGLVVAVGGGMAVVHMATAQSNDSSRALPPARVIWEQVPYQDPARFNNITAVRVDPRVNMPRTTLGDVDRTVLPILMPDASTGVQRNGMILSSLGDVYDVNLPQPTPGLRVLLSGSRVFVALPPGSEARTKPDIINIGGQDVPALVQKTEDGWLASFSRFGMSYTVEVICDQGPAESTCADSTYVRKVVAGMTEVVLGAAAVANREQNIEK